MERLRLRRMTPEEFEAFRSLAVQEYAATQVAAGNWDADTAPELAAKQTDEFLPQGAETAGMLLLSAELDDGKPIGTAWVALTAPHGSGAWIYAIEIVPEQRGRGWGRALLSAVELETGRHGADSIGLNVLGSNSVARGLYESSGYEIASLHMRKGLDASAGG